MSSFLDEIKERLKNGKADARLEIITGGGKSTSKKVSPWAIVGWVTGVGAVVALTLAIILFLNNQREKLENLNIVESNNKKAIDDLETEMSDDLATATTRLTEEQNIQNNDPNFTLLNELM